ncbi:MAG TPA: acyltransferase [Caulobacteraceae bacterium]|nr:acyltransferase [Caulobacteraceae bacterium]
MWVDALRGLAACLVVVSHYLWTPLAAYEGVWHYIISPGEAGVAAFFCISGLVIPFSVRKDSGPKGAAGFLINRAFRLYPAYWIAVLVAVLASHPPLRNVLINLTMAHRFVGVPDVIAVFWTLQVEIVFYAIITAFLVLGVNNRSKAYWVSWIVALSLALACGLTRYVLHIKAPVALFAGLTVMFGVATYFENGLRRALGPRLLHAVLAASVLILPATWIMSYMQNWGYGEVKYLSGITSIVNYSVATLTFVLFSRIKKVWGVFVFLGDISYPLYLFHAPIHDLIVAKLSSHLGFWGATGLSVVAALILATLVHRIIERPMIALGRRLAKPLRMASSQPPPPLGQPLPDTPATADA